MWFVKIVGISISHFIDLLWENISTTPQSMSLIGFQLKWLLRMFTQRKFNLHKYREATKLSKPFLQLILSSNHSYLSGGHKDLQFQ